MAGTSHFSRMQYHFNRGIREIVAPQQKLSDQAWNLLLQEFNNSCVYCGQVESKENRGIVADHLVSVTAFGELVLGNSLPACQKCNDSRGKSDWREFLKNRYPGDVSAQISKIENHMAKYPYSPAHPDVSLTKGERQEYEAIQADWETLIARARALRDAVVTRKMSEEY